MKVKTGARVTSQFPQGGLSRKSECGASARLLCRQIVFQKEQHAALYC